MNITSNEFYDGIVETLMHHFPEVPFYDEEIKQHLDEPAFFVQLIKCKHTREMEHRHRRSYSFAIQYGIATNRELRNVVEQLYGILEYIKISDSIFRGRELSCEFVNGALHFLVNYEFQVKSQVVEASKMRGLSQEGLISNGN